MISRLRHTWLAITALPGLAFSRSRRALFREMRAFTRNLPALLKAPLPEAMQRILPRGGEVHPPAQRSGAGSAGFVGERAIRDLADLAALLDRRSPLGVCLRRSLTRYHFLRRAGVPVVVHFGAKFAGGQADRDISGHAWLTLDEQIYYEDVENWRGFTVMLSYPQVNGKI